MKRQYWVAGKGRTRRNVGVWLAVPVLVAAFAYGALMLVPQLEQLLAELQTIPSADRAPENDSPREAAAADESGDAHTNEVAEAPIVERQVVERPVAPDPPSVPEPKACATAMTAALSNARIEFLSSSVEIVPASRNVISVLAALAHACPGRINIVGHSDNFGPEALNQQLSVARAQSVASAFIEFGLEPDRLAVRGFGSAQPIADNATQEGRARNRRIEMSLGE